MKVKALPFVAIGLLSAGVSAQTYAPAAPPAPPDPPAQVAIAAPPTAPAQSDAAQAPPVTPVADAPRVLSPSPPQAPATPQAPEPPTAFATIFAADGNFLGVHTEDVTRENIQRYGLPGEPRGVGIHAVVKGSPAEKAGLKAGDLILRFDGEPVTSVRKLERLIEESAPDHTVRLTVFRSGSEQELSVTLARRAPFVTAGGDGDFNFQAFDLNDAMRLGNEAARNSEQWKQAEKQMREKMEEMNRKHPGVFALAGSSRRIGVTTQPVGKQLADYFGVAHGVLVSSVEENGPAARAGLKAGDVLTEVDGKQVEDADDLVRELDAKQEGEVTLTFVRERKSRTVRLTPERRALPQGVLAPGAFQIIESPVAASTLLSGELLPPQVTPNPHAMPRVMRMPRSLIAPSHVTVLRPGERIL